MNGLISVSSAERTIAESLPMFGSAKVPLVEASGRILRQSVRAEREQPPFDRVMMDGIAIRWRGTLPDAFALGGMQMAGMHGQALPHDDACIEVTTGAILPDGCDCVIPVEQTRRGEDGYVLAAGYAPAQWQFIHRRGADCAAGTTVLEAGARIGAPEMSLLAANGVAAVEVAEVPSIAIVATGDELATVDAELQPGQIRRSNDLALLAALRQEGLDRVSLHHVADDPASLRDTLDALLRSHQVLVLSGGVSMGQRDYVPSCLEALGVRRAFHGIAQRPGKPMWFGIGPRQQPVFALPGNPVSSLVCMIRYVRPALLAAMGLRAPAPEYVRLAADVGALPPLTCFIPVQVQADTDGAALASPVHSRNSGDFTSLAGTGGVVELAAGAPPPAAGTAAVLYRW